MTFWHATFEVARKEVLQHFRTKRLLIIGALLLASLILMTLVVGVSFFGDIFDADISSTPGEHLVMLFYFSSFFVGGYFFIQLLSIVLTADAVCSEWSNRTVFLLLSKPVPRLAFVTGKFLGSLFTVVLTLFVLFTVDYLALQVFIDGSPSAADVGRFFLALCVLGLGAAAFAALALFFSTLTRSTIVSLLLTLGAWIIVLPLVGQIGLFASLGDDSWDGDLDDPQVDWSRYLNPGAGMTVAGKFLVPDDDDRAFLDFFSTVPANTGLAVASLVGHTALWFGLSLLVVTRRDFE